jgi:hypothetical protein
MLYFYYAFFDENFVPISLFNRISAQKERHMILNSKFYFDKKNNKVFRFSNGKYCYTFSETSKEIVSHNVWTIFRFSKTIMSTYIVQCNIFSIYVNPCNFIKPKFSNTCIKLAQFIDDILINLKSIFE